MTGNECCRCGQRVACPHCEDTREVATVSELRVSFEDGQWYASGVPYEEGTIRAGTISIHPADLPALCKALGMVPRDEHDRLYRAAHLLAANLGAETGSERSTEDILVWALEQTTEETTP
jgi:hypothetical protein